MAIWMISFYLNFFRYVELEEETRHVLDPCLFRTTRHVLAITDFRQMKCFCLEPTIIIICWTSLELVLVAWFGVNGFSQGKIKPASPIDSFKKNLQGSWEILTCVKALYLVYTV